MHRSMAALRAAAVVAILALVAACSGGASNQGPKTAAAPTQPTKVSGDITVLSNRTDLDADGTLKKYAAEFNKVYPNVKVTFQTITNYDGEVKVRMNTKNYGDVLLIPSTVNKSDFPKFFSSLGSAASLSKKYRFTSSGTVKGQVYGIAQNGNANGFVYNKAVWAKAGIAKWPTTPAQFLADMKKIKHKTSSIPYYTNYHDGWPLSSWEGVLGSVSCDPKANDDLASTAHPWAKGQELNVIDTLLFDVVHDKYTEADPTTTNWEKSKTLLAKGKIATMWLGSWAVSQMQGAAKAAHTDPKNIGFMPFPVQVDGHFCSVIGPDYLQAININSKHQEAARAWIDWFTDKSGYAQTQGDVPTLASAKMPPTLVPYQKAGVKLITLTQKDAAKVDAIDNKAEIGLTEPDYRQHLVDVARGAASGSLQQIFANLDKKWAAAEKTGGK